MTVHEQKLQDLVIDGNQFLNKAQGELLPGAFEFVYKVANSYRNTAGKLILNFGSVLAPVGDSVGNVLRNVQVD